MTAGNVLSSTSAPLRTANGVERMPRSTRDGSQLVADWTQGLIMEGRGFAANFGSITTPLTFLITADKRPDAWLRVPSGTALVLLGVQAVLEAAAGTATEIDIRACNNDVGNGTSSAASIGPVNLLVNSPHGITAAVVPRQLATGDVTAETTPFSLYRKTFPVAQASGLVPYDALYVPRPCDLLIGPATVAIYVAATTTQATGFVIMKWAELPSADVA